MRDSRRDEVSRFDDSSRIQPKGSVSGDCYLIYQDKCSRHVLWSSDEEDSVYLVHVPVLIKCYALQAYDFFFSLTV